MRDDDDNKLDADALSIMGISRVIDLRDDAADIAELLADPPKLPDIGTISTARLYRLVVSERETNRRLQCRLRALLVGSDI